MEKYLNKVAAFWLVVAVLVVAIVAILYAVGNPAPIKRIIIKDYDCADFGGDWAAANTEFLKAGGPELDPYGLDRNADGVPCESLR